MVFAANRFDDARYGRDGGDGPDADRGGGILAGFNLPREQQQLRHNHDHEDREVAESTEQRFHRDVSANQNQPLPLL